MIVSKTALDAIKIASNIFKQRKKPGAAITLGASELQDAARTIGTKIAAPAISAGDKTAVRTKEMLDAPTVSKVERMDAGTSLEDIIHSILDKPARVLKGRKAGGQARMQSMQEYLDSLDNIKAGSRKYLQEIMAFNSELIDWSNAKKVRNLIFEC